MDEGWTKDECGKPQPLRIPAVVSLRTVRAAGLCATLIKRSAGERRRHVIFQQIIRDGKYQGVLEGEWPYFEAYWSLVAPYRLTQIVRRVLAAGTASAGHGS